MYTYLFVINFIAFIVMGIDKSKARKGKWRISENTLILIAIIGGSCGMLIGMYYFRHKTKHNLFTIGIPSILIIQIILIVYFLYNMFTIY
ncbi:Hypothetical protein CM240_1056 [Clostridium bornimense]|uniref:Phosphoesterase n=1 Tax=Clostridium bornimense TaxID=1216932 RepID=W6SEV4_9CLOT|nr:DUF1294 domain-containing protein [Clostridium bornimense]CDM68220.1 Hypothetical protein CM240_1056 [Clostridium bornimense]